MSLLGRIYKPKKHVMRFFCPLCRSERGMRLASRSTLKNYIQMILTTACIVLALYPFMGMRSVYSFFVVWGFFELALRFFSRRGIPCPYCGFDASWYKKDVKMARILVEQFWAIKKEEKDNMKKEDSSSSADEIVDDAREEDFNNSLEDSVVQI